MKFSKAIFNKSYYLTTPIFYVNSVPHIGHLYTAVLADAQSRWKQLKNEDVIFATGTDEHGIKIQKKALEAKQDCQKFCDSISHRFRELFDKSYIKYSDFIRTTESRHKEAVYSMWNNLSDKGFIYKGVYDGWYCVNDENFLTDLEIEEKIEEKTGKKIMVSKESGHLVERINEQNYMFKLSEFKQQIKDYLNKNIIIPKNYAESLRSNLENIKDLSVSRESKRIHWGIPVPGDSSQIIYVWLDALVNYLTVAGYPNDMKKFAQIWPADVHIVGKDILRFHAIYWPAFLMAAGIELPKRIICHGHWLVNNKKMSKSIGNVIDPFECINKYTVDGLRYFLLREGVPDSDCNITEEKFTKFINVELANTLGNLYQRCLPFNKKQEYPLYEEISEFLNNNDKDFLKNLNHARDEVDKHFSEFNFYLGIQIIMSSLRDANNIVQTYEPWNLVKKNTEEDLRNLKKLLFLVYEALRICGILLQPIVPDISEDLLERLGVVDRTKRRFADAQVNYSSEHDSRDKMQPKSKALFKKL